jgi:hypothetical protein
MNRHRVREFEWQSIKVEAGSDCIFEIETDSPRPVVRLVLIPHGYVPFPETALNDLLHQVVEKWGTTPERFLVTATGLYAVMGKMKIEVRDGRTT